jgi:RimJ/RimL family protein N-acetyltransferase
MIDGLRGDKVRLTALTEEDLEVIAAWQDDTDLLRRLDAQAAAPRGLAQLRQWLRQRQERPDGYLFAVRAVDGAGLLGYAELDGILWPHRAGWLSLVIAPRDHWGRGFGREAMRLALWFAFAELNLHRVQLTVFAQNTRAIRLYEGLGFQREGAFREFLERDGERQDMLLYGLLAREWQDGARAEPTPAGPPTSPSRDGNAAH